MHNVNFFRLLTIITMVIFCDSAALQTTEAHHSQTATDTLESVNLQIIMPEDSSNTNESGSAADSILTVGTPAATNSLSTQKTAHNTDSISQDSIDSLQKDTKRNNQNQDTAEIFADTQDTLTLNTHTAVSNYSDSLKLDSSASATDSSILTEISDSLTTANQEPKRTDSSEQPLRIQDVPDTLMVLLSTGFDMPISGLLLDTAINYLLKFNPLVISARLEWKSNERKALAALGAFEPIVTGGYQYKYTGYNYRPYPEKNLDQSIGLKGRTISGGEYSFDYRVTDIRNSRSSLDIPQAFTGVSITQPLLRNAWYSSELTERKIAKIELETAYHTYRSKLIEMIAELQSTYWNLAFAQEKIRFALQSVQIAEMLVKDGKLRVKAGKMSLADLMEADAGLSTRQANLADAEQELLDAANQLKLLLSTDDIGKGGLLFCTQKIFVNNSEKTSQVSQDTYSDFDVTNHPEYCTKKLELEKESVLFKYRTRQCLPGLNAKGSAGLGGYGSKSTYAMKRLFKDPQPAWSAQLELELPIMGGVENRNLMIAQKLKKEAAEKNLSAIQYQIENSMRIITQRVAAHCDHANNSGAVVNFRQQLLDIEFKKLNAGKSNYRLIYETEEKLSEAKMLQLESNVRYRMALVQQAKISGSMLVDFALETIENKKAVLADRLTRRNWKD